MTLQSRYADRFDEARRSHKLNLSYLDLKAFPFECIEIIKKQNIRIRELDLSSNALTTLPIDLQSFRHVSILRLKYNKFAMLPRVLTELKFLTLLELSGNQITVIDDFVRHLTSLKELDLSCNLIKSLPHALFQMPKLEVLHLEHNRIEELPFEIESLKTLVKIDISTNVLKSLPKSMVTIRKLQRINCANNEIISVPPEMGFLKTLKEFNLRSNHLNTVYKAKAEEGLSRFLAFLREEHERERLAEIERLRPIGNKIGSYIEYRCKADSIKIEQNKNEILNVDHRCWIRHGHTAHQIKNVIYIFGGCLAKDGSVSEDLFWISTDRMDWNKEARITGDRPTPRFHHCSVYDPDNHRLIFFGGKSEKNRRLNDVYTLDISKMEGKKIYATGTLPSPRECASAVFCAEQIVLFGGVGSGSRTNDLFFLELNSMTWSQASFVGTAPSPRQSSALCIVQSTQLLLHGGQNHFVLDDLFVYDILSKTWTLLHPQGQIPPPRRGHQIQFVNGSVFLFGGFNELGSPSLSIYRLDIDSNFPLTQQNLVWKELDSELERTASRVFVIRGDQIGIFQTGSLSTGLPSSDDVDLGEVQWNVFKVTHLPSLKEKDNAEASIKPKNPKLSRVQHTQTIPKQMPRTYTMQSSVEKRMLEYCRHFDRIFFSLYPHRRPLILTPKNECGTEKFVCSFIRPTKLHYNELYDLENICKFVTDFVGYELLENPLHPPAFWSSPASTLKWQAGDSFDMATLLASILIGAGYEAYVCVGYAPEAIVFHDQSRVPFGYKDWDSMLFSLAEEQDGDDVGIAFQNGLLSYSNHRRPSNDHDVDVHDRFTSETNNGSGSMKPKSTNIEIEKDFEPNGRSNTDHPQTDAKNATIDDCDNVKRKKSKFIHAWVMIVPGSRDVTTRSMIEPSTGCRYSVETCPYEGIEFVFDHENFWICMQAPLPNSDSRAHPFTIRYELDVTSDWERVLPMPSCNVIDYNIVLASSFDQAVDLIEKLETDRSASQSKDDFGRECVRSRELRIDRWISRLHIPPDLFDMRCPRGYKKTIFRNCTVEKYAFFGDCARWDGLMDRITYYEHDHKHPIMIDHVYQRRKDKLARKCIRMDQETISETYDYFLPGNGHALKIVHSNEERCFLEFYPDSRADGLHTREHLQGKKTIEIFMNRSDRLIYRSIAFRPEARTSSSGNPFEIQKVTEKFSRDHSIDCDDDVAKRVFYLSDNRIRLDYHYGDERIARSSIIFYKNGTNSITQVNPLKPKLTPSDVLEMYSRLQTTEKESLQAVRDMEKEIQSILKDVQDQDLHVKLVIPYYDAARDTNRSNNDETDSTTDAEYDYLKPFLPWMPPDASLSKEQAMVVREKCLRSLKERLIERANIMQSRHDEELALLQKLTSNFNRDKDQLTTEQICEYEEKCNATKFKIHILQKRLKRHEEQALQRYVRLDQKLRNDERLKCITES